MSSENNTSNSNNTNKGNHHHHRSSQPSRRRQGPAPAAAAKKKNEPSSTTTSGGGQCVLVLHGNRQTGQLLLGRLDKLRRRVLKEFQLDCVAPDAPLLHPEDDNLRTWWNREENDYQGLEQSLETLKSSEQLKDRQVVGILGFSQGARLAHLVALLHTQDRQTWFPTLKFVIIAAGYDAPIPDGFPSMIPDRNILLDSLHVWGLMDPLISPDQSQAVTRLYQSPAVHVHDGKHYVPMKAPDVQVYVNFIKKSLGVKDGDDSASKAQIETTMTHVPTAVQASQATVSPFVPAVVMLSPPQIISQQQQLPDEETTIMQQEEVQALEAIFPDELILKSTKKEKNYEEVYDHPIVYQFKLLPSEDVNVAETNTNWPSRPLTLEATYPYNYPNDTIPIFRLIHENNIYEFPSARVEILMKTIKDCANGELGMPSVLSCIYAARDYLDAPPSVTEATSAPVGVEGDEADESNDATNDNADQAPSTTAALKTSTPEQINVCNLEGLSIAEEILRRAPPTTQATANAPSNTKGGSLTYTIGLVGKPSAGKSTFFNAATAFSRQRGDNEGDSGLGGASMAPHPFTTIDPNIGYCLVPAPAGSCPEDDAEQSHMYGSTHGRDPQGHRFLPVLLKDVAGLVPGAYQGRGRGNQFLNDLCDATVLIHVVDASGTADAQGNTTATDGDESACTNPLDDLAWIRNELVEWVYTNLIAKWVTIQRKGRSKLSDMFSGYGQPQSVTRSVFSALEKFLDEQKDRDHALDRIQEWDQADVHRLVSTFLGVRFPMALALNKCDLPSSAKHVQAIQEALPVHGAHVGTNLAARSEMSFVRDHLTNSKESESSKIPSGVWECLTSAMMLREPILVFPVSDMTTYAPLPGLHKPAVESPSLPSPGMVTCIKASGGKPPTCWNEQQRGYGLQDKSKTVGSALRDVVVMKPGSTVEDVFLALKRQGALGGEFVRAEGAGKIGEKSKPIPKHEPIGKHNRILKIMTNKRTQWQ